MSEVLVSVAVAVGVRVAVTVRVRVGVKVGVGDPGVGVEDRVKVKVGVKDPGVDVEVGVKVTVGVAVAVGVAVSVGVGVLVGMGDIWQPRAANSGPSSSFRVKPETIGGISVLLDPAVTDSPLVWLRYKSTVLDSVPTASHILPALKLTGPTAMVCGVAEEFPRSL